MLLVVTNRTDPACDFLILRLAERGIPFLRLNTERVGEEFSLLLMVGSDGARFEIRTQNGRVIRSEDVQGVYLGDPRQPTLDDVDEEDRAFARRETTEQLRSLWKLIDHDLWLNHPKNLWLASNKIEQLHKAHALGFAIPETIVSSSALDIKAFIRQTGGRAIVKAVKYGFELQCDGIKFMPTREIVEAEAEVLPAYAEIPSVYQTLLEKKFDVRVTVIGDQIFATAIYSQVNKETAVDWRVWDFMDLELPHEAHELPNKIGKMCRDLTRAFGLRYSAIDLVCTPADNYFFLELNPSGQWAWLEQLVGHPIRDAIIDALLPGGVHEPTIP